MQKQADAFGVYLHWPFCLSKCPYCDFNSHVRHAAIDEARYVRAFDAEIAATAARIPGRTVTTMFFGGGTPSLMQPSTVAAILDAVAKHWTVAPDVEITLEANPTSVEAERFRGYRAAGVNRVSLGVQSLDDRVLKELGRMHSAEEALAAVAVARAVFERYSFDLIYARPGQIAGVMGGRTQARHCRGRRASVALSIDHRAGDGVSRAAIGRQARRSRTATRRACFTISRSKPARNAGLPAYEISNHARPGAECRHNLVYWRGAEYAGIGPGAHGRLNVDGGRIATATEKRPETWLMRVESLGHGVIDDETLTREERADEYLLMGLRLAEGIDPKRYQELSGRELDPKRVAILHSEGAVETTAAGASARHAGLFPGARRRGGRSRGVTQVPDAPKDFGAGDDDLPAGRRDAKHRKPALVGAVLPETEHAVDCRRSRTRSRSLPARSVARLASSPAPRPERSRRRTRSRCAPDPVRISADSGWRNSGSRTDRAPDTSRRSTPYRRRSADRPTARCRAVARAWCSRRSTTSICATSGTASGPSAIRIASA